ncbi:response regulator transcription factor [Neobacillus niacini]|uniref:response regulator transcription factor n=1 Tax=Neobacillus niacini TaxID=86668 RepID=UPI002FFD6498
MYQLLIVDDEKYAVRGVQTGVQWEKLNISTIHVAYNIRQAKKTISSNPIDLMICDIEMPQGTGLDLLKWVREHYPKVETVFVSCHAEFSYAQEALRLGSFNYLLKPVDYDELEKAIEQAQEKLRINQEKVRFEETYQEYYRLWKSNETLVKERFWQDLIRHFTPFSQDRIKHFFKQHKTPMDDSTRLLPIYINVQRWYEALSSEEEHIMEYALRKTVEEKIAVEVPHAIVVPLDQRELIGLFPIYQNENKMELEEVCKEYIQFCNLHFYCDVNCYIGEPVYPHEVRPMVMALKELCERNVTMTNGVLVFDKRKKNKAESDIQLPPIRQWSVFLSEGSRDKLLSEVSAYIESLRKERDGIEPQWLHFFYQDFIQMVFYVLHVKGIQAHQVFSQSLLEGKSKEALYSLDALKNWVQLIVESTINYLHSLDGNQSLVEKVRCYVAENICVQSLTREDIANHVYLNPDYLTRVFKKETGMSISDYLHQERIEYAKRLLKDSVMSIGDIAYEVGYSKLSYFSSVFKRATELTPIEYRKQIQK